MMIVLSKDNIELTEQLYSVRELNVKKDRVETFLNNKNNHLVMEVIDNKIVGLVWGYTLERIDSSPMMFVYSVDVIKEYRRRGIAKRLVKYFIDYANERGYRNTFLFTEKENIPANKLYQSLDGEAFDERVLYLFRKGKSL